MKNLITAPILRYEDIRVKADEFLKCYNPSSEIPMPIEEIVEFRLKIDIVPIPGLRQLIDMDGFISSDLTVISVDQYVQEKFIYRYFFTLGHEVGHCFLHADIYKRSKFNSIEKCKVFIDNIPEKENSWLEWQANSFAGLILVPRENLLKEVELTIQAIRVKGISLENEWDFAWDVIADYLEKKFCVSSGVIHTRIYYDKIKEQYRSQ